MVTRGHREWASMACDSWHSLGSPGGEKKAQAKTTREGGAEVTGGRGGESRAQIHSLSPGLTNDSGVCLIPGFVTVVLRCPVHQKGAEGPAVGSVPAAFGVVHLPGSASVSSPGIPGL